MPAFYRRDSRLNCSVLIIQQRPPPLTDAEDPDYAFYPAHGWSSQVVTQLNDSTAVATAGVWWFDWMNRYCNSAFSSSAIANLYSDAIYKVDDSCCAPQAVPGAGPLAINGRFASGGSCTFETGSNNAFRQTPGVTEVLCTSSAAETSHLTITGKDFEGNTITEDVVPSVLGTAGTLRFKSISSVVASGAMLGVVRVGGNQGIRAAYNTIEKATRANRALAMEGLGFAEAEWQALLNWDGGSVSIPGSSVTKALEPDPMTTIKGSNIVTIRQAGHGLVEGSTVRLSGITGFNGLLTPSINGNQIVDKVLDANNWQLVSNNNADASGAGGGPDATVMTFPTGGSVLGFQPLVPVAVGDATVNVLQPGHPWITGETVTLALTGSCGGLPVTQLEGARVVTVVDADTWSFEAGRSCTNLNAGASFSSVIPTGSLVGSSGTPNVTVRMANHGLRVGESATLSGFTDVAGIAAGSVNGLRNVVAVPDKDNFIVQAGANATSTASGGGTAGSVVPHYSLTYARNRTTKALTVTQVHVNGACSGNISVGGIVDGASAVFGPAVVGAAGDLLGAPVTLPQEQEVTISSTGNDSVRTFTVTGVNANGQDWSLDIAGPNVGSVTLDYNYLLSHTTNTYFAMLDLIPLVTEQADLAEVDGMTFDYEVQDGRTSGVTLQFIQDMCEICHTVGIKAMLYPNTLDATSQANTALTQNILPAVLDAVDYIGIILWDNNQTGTLRDSWVLQMEKLGYPNISTAHWAKILPVPAFGGTTLEQMRSVREIIEAFPVGKKFMIWYNNAPPGQSGAYDDTNLKIAALGMGNSIARPLLTQFI